MHKKLICIVNLLFWICAGTAPVMSSISNISSGQNTNIQAHKNASSHPVFFITDRASTGKQHHLAFGTKRSSGIAFGECLEAPQSNGAAKQTMVVFNSEQEFLAAVRSICPEKLPVFVHGYNESFAGSIESGKELAAHLDTPVIVFSWPSKNNPCSYMNDECAAEWSSHDLAEILGDLGRTVGFHKVAIIAHSLGARLVEWSLKDLCLEQKPDEQFATAMFITPDVDRDVFLRDSQFLLQTCSGCRVFLDRHDTSIWVSKLLHGNARVCADNSTASQIKLSQIFQYNIDLPNHNSIPFDQIAVSMHEASAKEATKQASLSTVRVDN